VKKLCKVFAREVKRRKDLPLELKQEVSYEILQRLRDLGEDSNNTEQRGLQTFCLIDFVAHSYVVDVLVGWKYCMVHHLIITVGRNATLSIN
jgi:hypothetical protein